MVINEDIKKGYLQVKVVPNSSREELIEEDNRLKLYLKAVSDKDKANKELIRFFKREFDLHVEIKSGRYAREKMLRVY